MTIIMANFIYKMTFQELSLIMLFNGPNAPMKKVLLLASSFYRWGNWVTGRLNNFSHYHLASKELLHILFIAIVNMFDALQSIRHTSILFTILSTLITLQSLYSCRVSKKFTDHCLRPFI